MAVQSASAGPLSGSISFQDTDRYIGTYRREEIGASGRVVELLDLKSDLSAFMTGEYENRGNVVRSGNWTLARDRVIVTFAPIETGGTPLVIEFSQTGGGWFRSGKDLKVRKSTPKGTVKEGVVYKRMSDD
ncbi:MAG: hypothetical protein AB7Q37_04320 [Pyrinomonadaceae bacterium]